MLSQRLREVLSLLGADLCHCQIHVAFLPKGESVGVEKAIAYVTHQQALVGENIPSERCGVRSDQELRLLILIARVPAETLAQVAHTLGVHGALPDLNRAITRWVLEGEAGG